MKSGYLLIDKPPGITSHDVVNRIRKVTGVKKVGHGGTLDPFATGLLVIGVGRTATRELGSVSGKNKEYEAVMRLGATSDTQDKDGNITMKPDAELPTEDDLRQAMSDFIGNIQQIPPMYSAKKIAGEKLYEKARRGEEIEREPVSVTIEELELQDYDPPYAKFRVRCGSGTYIRTLAHDIGQQLGCGAYLDQLRRTKIGEIDVSNAVKLDKLDQNSIDAYLSTDPN